MSFWLFEHYKKTVNACLFCDSRDLVFRSWYCLPKKSLNEPQRVVFYGLCKKCYESKPSNHRIAMRIYHLRRKEPAPELPPIEFKKPIPATAQVSMS